MIISEDKDIVLRDFEAYDIPRKVDWINDPENNRFLHYELPASVEKTLKWFKEKDDGKRVDCMIEYRNTAVGLIGLLQIDRINLKAEYYVTMGEKSYKHRGIATKATKAIIDYGFSTLQLHKIYLTVDAENEAAIKLYEKSGFKQEGYFRDDLMHRGRLIDRVRYAILRGEA